MTPKERTQIIGTLNSIPWEMYADESLKAVIGLLSICKLTPAGELMWNEAQRLGAEFECAAIAASKGDE